MPVPIIFRKAMVATALLGSLTACATAGSGPRTQQYDQRGKVEIRIENNNWSTARVYVAASGSRPYRIATVNSGRTETKYVRISTYFVLRVTLLAGSETWIDFTDWSSNEECLRITITNALAFTNVVPCRP